MALCAVVSQCRMGCVLDEGFSLSALAVALQELPKAWAGQANNAPKPMPLQVGSRQSGVFKAVWDI